MSIEKCMKNNMIPIQEGKNIFLSTIAIVGVGKLYSAVSGEIHIWWNLGGAVMANSGISRVTFFLHENEF